MLRWLMRIGAMLACGSALWAMEAPAAPTRVEDFALLDQHGRYHRLTAQADVPVVVIYAFANGCPIVRQDIAELNRLAGQFASTARILLVDAAIADDRASVATEANALATTVPVLLDPVQSVSRDLGFERTGEALVVTTKNWQIVWRGPLSDRLGYGAQKSEAGRNFLSEAITAAVAGKPGPSDAPAAKGCKITYDALKPVDYATEIAPLLVTHCASCHAAGGVAPFALAGHAQAKSHAAMIKEVLRTRRMPPWGADAPGGTFIGDNVLTNAETARLIAWIDAGTPRGEGADALATPRAAPAEWPLGKPDLIVDCPPQQVPATGVVPYRRLVVDVDLPKNVWVRAYDLHPSVPAVMHHAFAFGVPAGVTPKPGDPRFSGLDDFLADYVPGLGPIAFPDGCGKPLTAGARIGFQLHYTTSGTAVTDRPRLGLYLSSVKPAREVRIVSIKQVKFTIPPGVRDVPAEGKVTTPTPVTLLGMSPHMHLRGSRMAFTATLPDGSLRPLLSVPRYDLNWQAMYRPVVPLTLPAGTVITCRGAWDNSRFNESNPDPSKTVQWGEQSWDEMFLGYLVFTVP